MSATQYHKNWAGHLPRVLAVPLFTFCLSAAFAISSTPQIVAPNRMLPATQLVGFGFGGTLADLAQKYRVPVGVESAHPKNEETTYWTTTTLPPGTLSRFLDIIVSTDGRYAWQEIDGLIEVYPVHEREKLLDVVIRDFSIEGNFDVEEVKAAIFKLPEVNSSMTKLRTKFVKFLPKRMISGGDNMRSFSIHAHDVTLRTLLNEIARKSEHHCWIVERWGKKGEYIKVEF